MQGNTESQLFIQEEGPINWSSYLTLCQSAKVATRKTVLIFPGNIVHNQQQTLYNIKQGGGLAQAAAELGAHKVPTLSLPTTLMPIVNIGETNETARQAVADLWKAAGYGCSFVLPVRKKAGRFDRDGNAIPPDLYFGTAGLDDANQFEPKFWGLNEPTPNIQLGQYYLIQLKLLIEFLTKPGLEPPMEFQEAYREGQLAKTNPTPWFLPVNIPEVNATNSNDKTRLLGNTNAGKTDKRGCCGPCRPS
jgi:hypothetical protein